MVRITRDFPRGGIVDVHLPEGNESLERVPGTRTA